MSKMHIGLLVCTILVPAAALAAELPKQGSFKATFFETEVPAKTTTVPYADGKTASFSEGTFVYINDAGSGFMHRTTGRCLVSSIGNAAGWHSSGPCTYADPDGDLIFSTFYLHGGGNVPPAGTKEYLGGTGKYVGLTGHATFTMAVLRPMDKGSPRTVEGHVQGTYKIEVKVATP